MRSDDHLVTSVASHLQQSQTLREAAQNRSISIDLNILHGSRAALVAAHVNSAGLVGIGDSDGCSCIVRWITLCRQLLAQIGKDDAAVECDIGAWTKGHDRVGCQ